MPLRVFLVDDEAPARERLKILLADIAGEQPTLVVGEAADGLAAMAALAETPVDVVLSDIRMPRMDGLELARHLARLPKPPAIVFATAYDRFAVEAFELCAVDYLLKPVRAARLSAALAKAAPLSHEVVDQVAGQEARRFLSCNERGRILLVPVSAILFLKAEQKYVTARTVEREYLLDDSLTQLEGELGEGFIRLHRNCLVARSALAGFDRVAGEEGGDGQWNARVHGVDERLPVSRRQWPLVREVIRGA